MSEQSNSKFDRCLDRGSKIFAIVGGLAMVWVTFHFSQVATNLSQQGINVSKENRRGLIVPNLEILPSFNYTKDYEEITVPIKNLGPGKAIKMRAFVAYEGKIRGEAFHLFEPIERATKQSGKVLINTKGSQQDLFTLGSLEGRDWIEPDEVLFFRFSPWLDVERPKGLPSPNRKFTIFISYYDIDMNEFLFVTKLPVGGRSSLILVAAGDSDLNDSLLSLAQSIKLFTYKVYDEIILRTENGKFRSFRSSSKELSKDSTSKEDSLIK